MFVTFDENHDPRKSNCASNIGGDGGNWWGHCGYQNINGIYGTEGDAGYKFMHLKYFDSDYFALKSMRWMIKSAV